MMDCVYIGDSIAVGLQKYEPSCGIYAKVGADTDFIVKKFSGTKVGGHAVISMGSNAPMNPRNYQNALKLRKSLDVGFVVWILPYDRKAAAAIRKVAEQFSDAIVDLSAIGIPTKDRVHPNYRRTSDIVQDIVAYAYE